MTLAYGAGIGALLLFWVIGGVASGQGKRLAFPWELIRGEDGAASTSKFQFFLFTAVVLFAYVAIYVRQWEDGAAPSLDELPRNVLIAMGLSAATLSAAKGIAYSQQATGKAPRPEPKRAPAGGIFLDDDGAPDLAKVQMVAWTVIGVLVYLVNTVKYLQAPNGRHDLPDIDATLMVLMGLGQGAYLGRKLVPVDAPRLLGVNATLRTDGATLSLLISGTSFGDTQGGSFVVVDGVPVSKVIDTANWGDALVRLDVSRLPGVGTAPVSVALIVGGRTSNVVVTTPVVEQKK